MSLPDTTSMPVNRIAAPTVPRQVSLGDLGAAANNQDT